MRLFGIMLDPINIPEFDNQPTQHLRVTFTHRLQQAIGRKRHVGHLAGGKNEGLVVFPQQLERIRHQLHVVVNEVECVLVFRQISRTADVERQKMNKVRLADRFAHGVVDLAQILIGAAHQIERNGVLAVCLQIFENGRSDLPRRPQNQIFHFVFSMLG